MQLFVAAPLLVVLGWAGSLLLGGGEKRATSRALAASPALHDAEARTEARIGAASPALPEEAAGVGSQGEKIERSQAARPSAAEPVEQPDEDQGEVEGAERAEGPESVEEDIADEVDADEGPADSRQERAARASSLVNQGHSFRRKGQHRTARSRYEEALEVYGGYPRALAGLAQLEMAEGNGARAVRYAERLVLERPGQLTYQILLGDALQSAGQHARAVETWQKAKSHGSRVASARLKSATEQRTR
jgi:tetratricopeptide (TPR) repeat protein